MRDAARPQRNARGIARLAASACLGALTCACGADGSAVGGGPALPQAPAGDVAPAALAADAGLTGTEGAISPVPAFRGGDADWRIEIQSVGDLQHDVVLTQGGVAMRGTLRYRALSGTGGDGPFDLRGVVHAPQGDASMRVHLQREACLDARGAHAWQVLVDVDGQAPRAGCGDLPL